MVQNKTSKPIIISIIFVCILALVIGAYFTGQAFLGDRIKSGYKTKDCAQVIEMNKLYTNLYTATIADQSLTNLTHECNLYSMAHETEHTKNWQETYNTYQAYKRYYPKGLFASEAEEKSLLALTNLAKEELAAKKYTDAFETVGVISESFDDIKTDADTNGMVAEIYKTWIEDQRETNDFDETIKTIKEFNAWAQDANSQEYTDASQFELTQTYLTWGEALASKKQFETASAKFDMAVSSDPKSLVDEVKTAKAKLYMTWGDSFIEQNDFPNAVAQYQTAVTQLDTKDQAGAQDQVAGVYLKWATSLSHSDDFQSAFEKIEQAKTTAATNSGKENVETAQANLYQALSTSSSAYALQVMDDAAGKICGANHTNPELPIFGTDTSNIRIHLYSHPPISGTPTNKVKATMPASMHYVACLSVEKLYLSTHRGIRTKPDRGYLIPIFNSQYTVERYSILWNIEIYNLNDMLIAAKQFVGAAPPRWEKLMGAMEERTDTFATFTGDGPSLEKISAWISQYMK